MHPNKNSVDETAISDKAEEGQNDTYETTETKLGIHISQIKDALEEVADIKWEEISITYDDDEKEEEEGDEEEAADEDADSEINYTFDYTKKPEDVAREVYKSLRHWIKNDMELSTITKIEAAFEKMSLVFNNDDQRQQYKNMLQTVQEALNQLSSGILSKIDDHVCFYGDHHKSLLERHLKTESRNAMDDLANFFESEKHQGKASQMGKLLTKQGIDRVFELYSEENHYVIQHEKQLASDCILKMKQCFLEKLKSTLNGNTDVFEKGSPGIDEIKKRLKNDCFKAFYEAFHFEERVNEVHALAEKTLDTEIEKEMQQFLTLQKQENDLDTDSHKHVPKEEKMEPVSEKNQGKQQRKNMDFTKAATEKHQNKIPPPEKIEQATPPNPQSLQTANYVSTAKIQLQNNRNTSQPQDTTNQTHQSKNPSEYSSTQQKVSNQEACQVSQLPDKRIKGTVDSANSEKTEFDLPNAYSTNVQTQQGKMPTAKKIQILQQSRNLQLSEEATEGKRAEIPPPGYQEKEPSPKSQSPEKGNYVTKMKSQFQEVGTGVSPHNTPKQFRSTLPTNPSKQSSPKQVKDINNSAEAPFMNMDSQASQPPSQHSKPNVDSGKTKKSESDLTKVYIYYLNRMKAMVNHSNDSGLIHRAHAITVHSSQEQPAYRKLEHSDKDKLRKKQDKYLEDLLKDLELKTSTFSQQNLERNVYNSMSATPNPVIKLGEPTGNFKTVFTNAKANFLNGSASDSNQNATGLPKPKQNAAQKVGAAFSGTANKTRSVEMKNQATEDIRLALKVKVKDLEVLLENQKFKAGSDTLLQDANKVVSSARNIAWLSSAEDSILRQIDIIERTRENLLKAVVGSRY